MGILKGLFSVVGGVIGLIILCVFTGLLAFIGTYAFAAVGGLIVVAITISAIMELVETKEEPSTLDKHVQEELRKAHKDVL